MKVQYYTATTLDGFIADARHSLDWLFQFESLEDTSYPEFIRDVGALVMGSSTYEWLLRHHVYADESAPQPWPYEQPCWVFTTRSLREVPGADVRFASGDVSDHVEGFHEAAGDRNLWVVGGGDLAGQFHDRGLLDEIIVQLAPVTLGAGAPLLPRRIDRPHLEVLAVSPYRSGLIEIRYAVPKGDGP